MPGKKGDAHRATQKLVMELGQALGFEPGKEHNPVGRRREPLDVIWLPPKSEGAVPRAVFEVHHQGELDKAFRKLKDARRRWNCSIHIVTTPGQVADVRARLEASYQDLSDDLSILTEDEVRGLLEQVQDAKHRLDDARVRSENFGLPWPD